MSSKTTEPFKSRKPILEWEPVRPSFTSTAAALGENKSRNRQETASLTASASSRPPLFVTMQLSICKSPPLGRHRVFRSAGNDCSHNNNATGSKCQEEKRLSDWSGPLKSGLIARAWCQARRRNLGRVSAACRTPSGPVRRLMEQFSLDKQSGGELLVRLFQINLREDGNLTACASAEGSAEAGA